MSVGYVIQREPVTTALIAALEAAIYPRVLAGGRDTSKVIGDARAPFPVPPAIAPGLPYAMVHSIDGGHTWGGEFEDMNSGGTFVYQVTSVGENRIQAEWMGDAVRSVVLGRHPNGSGYITSLDTTDTTVTPPILVVDRRIDVLGIATEVGRLFNVIERYVLAVTPGLGRLFGSGTFGSGTFGG